ncbi:glycoside hydrolase [Amylostereum chailletii]|nr:glycoside hydrolase [Amylostereum chailletii]
MYAAPKATSRRKMVILGAIAALILLILAVIIPVYFTVIRPHGSSDLSSSNSNNSTGSTSGNSTSSGSPVSNVAITGGDGSEVTTDGGTKFTYHNSFGGTWYYDAKDPFNNGARAQSWSPGLNETFRYGVDTVRGVNLGGWLVTEPFSVPALYQKYSGVVDEWELSEAMRADTGSGGGISQLEDHYKTFITEQDFADIAAAGLNYVRIPLGYWAIETRDGEPFLANVSWQYFLKAINWARKYGIRINLDFHSVPGSQNGWNHSGRLGTISWLNGTMGYANAQRSLDYVRILAEFISQPQYKDVVTMFGVINEPRAVFISEENIERYYLGSYEAVRLASGTGAGNGPMISFHDAFRGLPPWVGYLPGADRVSLDYHPYLCFDTQPTDQMSAHVTKPCSAWGSIMNTSMDAFGLTVAGEFSLAITDCGTYVNGVGQGSRYDGTYNLDHPWPRVGDCSPWIKWQAWDDDFKQSMKTFALSSMDALQNWFFWTWKVGNSSTSNSVEAPAWSYQLGLQQGWMPTDPRVAAGACGNTDPRGSTGLSPSQTGGSGAGNIKPTDTVNYAWPPTTVTNAGPITELPSYTPTGTIPTLPAASFTTTGSVSVNAGNGWANPSDQVGLMVPIAGCSYLSPWVESAVAAPPLCTPAAKREQSPLPTVTPPPTLRGRAV